MSRNRLHDGEIALLGKLNRSPVELGDLPSESVARLTALGLARKVLGYCEITRAGQLTYKRDQLRRGTIGGIARMARRNPLSLIMRRRIDTQLGNTSFTRGPTTRLPKATTKTTGN